MKKLFLLCSMLCFICSCTKPDDSSSALQNESASVDKETVFSFNAENLNPECESNSKIVCAINTAIKCTINPEFTGCDQAKDILPSFVFMQDESLQRPTFQSYQIDNISPREDGSIEVHTKSSCNGNWFGLCNGNIIYVMEMKNSEWIIKDMYAVEF